MGSSTVVDDPKDSGIAEINADTNVAEIPDKNADYTIIAEITKNVLVSRDSEHNSLGSYSSTIVDEHMADTLESYLGSYKYGLNYDSEDSDSDSDEDIEDDEASDHVLDTGLRCKECGKFFAGPNKVFALMQHQVWYQCGINATEIRELRDALVLETNLKQEKYQHQCSKEKAL